jgi:nicotinamide-nucleotide amidase
MGRRQNGLSLAMETTGISDLASRVIKIAQKLRVKIVTAESCTAGTLSTILADTPGAGDVFLGGFVTYAKASKSDVLGISGEILERYSAVSEETAGAMTQAALISCPSADVAIAITCVGGPEPDEDNNPVGLAFLSVQCRNYNPYIRRFYVEESSSGRVRGEVLTLALQLLLEKLRNRETMMIAKTAF